jgi:hypothetical protein
MVGNVRGRNGDFSRSLRVELASADTTQLFTTARRKKAINDAVDVFIRATGCTRRYGSLPLVDNTQEYDLETTFTDYIRLAAPPSIKIVYTGVTDRYIQGEDLPRRTAEELDMEEPGWRATTKGTPGCWYLKDDGGATNIGFVPAPDVDTGYTWTAIIPYVASISAMTDDAAIPFTIATAPILRLYPYHQALVHYAAGLLEPLRKNYSGVQRQMQLYAGIVAQYFQQQRQDGPEQLRLSRDYYRDASRGEGAHDWRTWP